MTNADILAQVAVARTALDAIAQGLLTNVPPPPVDIHVAVGASLQAAIDAATVSGQNVLVAPGTYGPITLRARPVGAAPITIRPDVDPSTLPTGRRTTQAPVIITPAANIGIGTDKGARGWLLSDIGVSSPGVDGTMVNLDAGATMLADVPTDITLRRVYLDGGNACKRGIAANAANFVLIDSSIVGVMKQGQDTQALASWNGPGPFLIQNTTLSASGENIIFGGADPTIPNLVPSDIVIRGNTITKDRAWQTLKGTAKNCVELKNAQRVLIEQNIVENSWLDGQTGFLFALSVRNQGDTAPWSTVQNVEIRNNVLRHAWQGFTILGLDDILDAAGVVHPSVRMTSVKIHHNLIYDLGATGFGTGTRVAFLVNNGVDQLTIDHNTVLGTVSEALSLSIGRSKTVSTGFVLTNNVLPEGNYGIAADTGATIGTPAWLSCVDAASVFDSNLIAQGTSGRKIPYPGAHTVVVPGLALTWPFTPPTFTTADGSTVGVDLALLPAFDPAQ